MEENSGWRGMVRQNRHLSEYDKELLSAVFEELSREQESILAKIEERVIKELSQPGTECWDIVTALVDQVDVDKSMDREFEEIVKITSHREHMNVNELEKTEEPGNVYCAGTGFLKCSYCDIGNYTDQEYWAKITINQSQYQVPYHLYRSFVFFSEEEKLERAAAQYHVQVPFLYSPMSRRAVVVKVDLGDNEDIKNGDFSIDFQYRANGLENVMLPGKTLVWNVSMAEKEQMPRPGENTQKKVSARFDKECMIYKFETRENEYIYVESQETDLRRIDGDVYLGVTDGHAIEDLRYWRLCIHPYIMEDTKQMEYCFRNRFKKGKVFKDRIRTEGDIRYILGCFEGEEFQYEGCQSHLNGASSVTTYDRKSSYHYPKNKHLRSSSFCYVKLKETDSIYAEDWVSYVMAYMNYFYPEFYWVGVV